MMWEDESESGAQGMEGSEHTNSDLHAALDRQAKQAQESDARSNELLNEVSRINNELMTSQRALAKQAARLGRLNHELQREQEKSKLLLAQLEQSNRALQDFAAVASHDLQAPLRKIESFAAHLQAECTPMLSEAARDSLERIQSSTQHMRTFVTDLLALAQTTMHSQPLTPVDLARAARQVVCDMELQVQECGGRVEVADLPTIEADPLQMYQLFQNLIGNALKFRHPDVPPVVTVIARRVGPTDAKILITDNGIGFEEKYLERIFTPFQRLHGRSQYEGTGMGLSICRKIAERHSGHITATSTPGQGTTFIVTLPLKQLNLTGL